MKIPAIWHEWTIMNMCNLHQTPRHHFWGCPGFLVQTCLLCNWDAWQFWIKTPEHFEFGKNSGLEVSFNEWAYTLNGWMTSSQKFSSASHVIAESQHQHLEAGVCEFSKQQRSSTEMTSYGSRMDYSSDPLNGQRFRIIRNGYFAILQLHDVRYVSIRLWC